MKKKVVAYIPIKLNNERTPGKNLKPFDDGTPLCAFMFNTLTRVSGIDEAYCFCSSEEIVPYLPEGIRFLKRSKDLDTSATQNQHIIRAFLDQVPDAEIVVLCHVTCPFVKAETIEKCIAAVQSGEYDSAFTAAPVRDFLWLDGKPINYNPENAVRTQELPPIYKETIGCYVFTKEAFLKRNGKIGYHPYVCEVGEFEDVDIDYPEDFAIANAIYMNVLKKKVGDEKR